MSVTDRLICPICKNPLSRSEHSLRCERYHCYDFAKSGYINLLSPGKMNNARAGDSKEMIRARSLFFESGAYKRINDKICDLVCEFGGNLVLDAGCGEGYYTNAVAGRCADGEVIGFDMSKWGCEHASKVAKASFLKNTQYCVGNIFDLPVANGCADVVLNMFAPVASEEFKRVLRAGGHLIVASAGEHHLEGLKRVMYDEVYLNEVDFPAYDGFELVRCDNIKYDTEIVGRDTIWALFQMTPYFHRTSLDDKKKLESLDRLSSTVEVNFSIYRKM